MCAASLSWFPGQFMCGWGSSVRISSFSFQMVCLCWWFWLCMHGHVHVHVHVLHVQYVYVCCFKTAIECMCKYLSWTSLNNKCWRSSPMVHFHYNFVLFTTTCVRMCRCQWWMVGTLVFAGVSLLSPCAGRSWRSRGVSSHGLCLRCADPVCAADELYVRLPCPQQIQVCPSVVLVALFMCTRVGAWRRKEWRSLLKSALLERVVYPIS